MASVIQIESIDQLDGVLNNLLEDVAASLESVDYTDVLRDQLDVLEQEHAAYFQSRAGPDGSPWPPNAPSTRRRKGHGIPLFESGDLRQSLTTTGDGSVRVAQRADSHQHSLVFGTSLSYSAINQMGTSQRPARPHVGMTAESLDRFVETIADAAVEALAE